MLAGAVTRIFSSAAVNYNGVLFFAVIGLIVNGFGAYKTISGEKISERVVCLHLLEDVLSWAAVLVVGLAMKIFDMPIFDPILSIFITLFILYNAIRNIKEIFEILLDKSAGNVNIEELEKRLVDGQKILGAHHFHSWTDGLNNFLTLHVIIHDFANKNDIIEIKKYIRAKLLEEKINHVTIEIEFESEDCIRHECFNVKK